MFDPFFMGYICASGIKDLADSNLILSNEWLGEKLSTLEMGDLLLVK